jgi:tetratricopeptide (TPR) repeat protein
MKQHLKEENFKQSETSDMQSCVGWFKLSELVARKEKEKALSLYRLLSHSFEDRAYALQLEGDILWSLEDGQALEKYAQAAYLYKKEKKVVSAVAVYEHLLTLQPKNYEFLSKTILLYAAISWPEKFEERLNDALSLFDAKSVMQEQMFELCKKIIDFASNKVVFGAKSFDEIYDLQDDQDRGWVVLSLKSILEKRNSQLLEFVENL